MCVAIKFAESGGFNRHCLRFYKFPFFWKIWRTLIAECGDYAVEVMLQLVLILYEKLEIRIILEKFG